MESMGRKEEAIRLGVYKVYKVYKVYGVYGPAYGRHLPKFIEFMGL